MFLLLKHWVPFYSLHQHNKPANALVQCFFPKKEVLPPTLCKKRQMAEGREQIHSF